MGGKKIKPSLIDRVQDRYGRTVFTHEKSQCLGCVVEKWEGQSEPEIIENREQVINPLTAYQITFNVARCGGNVELGEQFVKLENPSLAKPGRRTMRKMLGLLDIHQIWLLVFILDMIILVA